MRSDFLCFEHRERGSERATDELIACNDTIKALIR